MGFNLPGYGRGRFTDRLSDFGKTHILIEHRLDQFSVFQGQVFFGRHDVFLSVSFIS
jgi:hypothetical protein